MTINDLRSNRISTLNDFEIFIKRNRLFGYFFVPEKITSLVESYCNSIRPASAVILNSNYGEISSKLNHLPKSVSIELNSSNVLLANYLNPGCEFINEDPLNFTPKTSFEFVVAFPPLGQRIEVNGRNIPVEPLYIRKALSLLSENGRAIFILQSSILSAPLYEDIRNHIQRNFGLSKIIRLPRGIINNIGIELTALIVSKTKTYNTEFYSLNNSIDFNNDKPDFTVSQENLSNRWDYNFHNPLNQEYENKLNDSDTKKIADLVDITFGVLINQSERKQAGTYKIIAPRNIIDGELVESNTDKFLAREVLNAREEKAILRYGDILFPRFTSHHFSIYIHEKKDGSYIANQHMVILRGANAEYVTTYLNTESGLNIFNQQIARHARGSTIPIISREDLENIRIPILPIENMELASKNKLQQLSYNELLEIKEKYEELKSNYLSLKAKSNTKPYIEQLQGLQSVLNQVLINQSEHSKQLSLIEEKIDDVKLVLINMSNDFQEIKQMPREVEEKINRLNKSLDEKLSSMLFEQKQLDSYIEEIKKWFDYYELLESKSQKYLPEAEYILDHISKLDNPDYSPFILQYCRALENELLNKIFRAYLQSIVDRKLNFEHEFAWDLVKNINGKPNDENTFRLSSHIKKCLQKDKEEWFFELGSMEVYLRYLTGRTIDKSPLLQDLKRFVLEQFNKELLSIQFLDEIKTIIKDFRNQSAHPNIMDTEKAIIFHKQMKECLINLMGNYKV